MNKLAITLEAVIVLCRIQDVEVIWYYGVVVKYEGYFRRVMISRKSKIEQASHYFSCVMSQTSESNVALLCGREVRKIFSTSDDAKRVLERFF